MKNLWIVILSLTAAVSSFSQTKTVTNNDLEKFRQKRLESEKKLKTEYARLGFPSPEELEKQNEQRRQRMEQYADELRAQQAQSENDLAAQADVLRNQLVSIDAQINFLRGQGYAGNNQTLVY